MSMTEVDFFCDRESLRPKGPLHRTRFVHLVHNTTFKIMNQKSSGFDMAQTGKNVEFYSQFGPDFSDDRNCELTLA
eukprot:scaffold2799_cov117-Cylindrotheca_fusiformis.AAC.2